MEYATIVMLLFGHFVREFFTNNVAMNKEQYDKLLSYAYSQVDLWNEGVRNADMHDTTLFVMSALEERDLFVENVKSPDIPYIADSGMDQLGTDHVRCNKCGKWDIYCAC